jgi:hypothetical protein
MAFVLSGLDPVEFQDVVRRSDAQLEANGMRRMRVDKVGSFPCRVSLEDAALGEEVVLLPYVHQPTDSPYRASGPIFVRQAAKTPVRIVDTIPPYLSSRMLSVRAYNSRDEIIDAEVVAGDTAEAAFRRLLANEAAAYLHVHFARYGCFGCRVDRQ